MGATGARATLALVALLGLAGCGSAGPGESSAGPYPSPGANWAEEYKAAGIAQGDALKVPCGDYEARGATNPELIYELSVLTLYPDGLPPEATASSVPGLAPAVQRGLVPADAPLSTVLRLQAEVAYAVCGF